MRRTARFSFAFAIPTMLLAGSPRSVHAQQVTVAAAADSTAWVSPRQSLDLADAVLRTRDWHVALLLNDSAVVLQFTDSGLDHVAKSVESRPAEGVGGRFLARMLGAGVVGLLDHAIAYRVSALREARVEGNRLILEGREGGNVFENVEVNGRYVMADFAEVEAHLFAAAVNRAIRRRDAGQVIR